MLFQAKVFVQVAAYRTSPSTTSPPPLGYPVSFRLYLILGRVIDRLFWNIWYQISKSFAIWLFRILATAVLSFIRIIFLHTRHMDACFFSYPWLQSVLLRFFLPLFFRRSFFPQQLKINWTRDSWKNIYFFKSCCRCAAPSAPCFCPTSSWPSLLT